MSDISSNHPFGGPLDSSGISDSAETGAESASPSQPESSGLGRSLKQIIWAVFALACLITFTLLKLPEDRVRAYVQGSINEALANQGITLSAAQSYMSIGLGLTYTMKDVTLSFPQPSEPAKLDQMSVSPSLVSLIMGNISGNATVLTQGAGKLTASFSFPRAPKAGSTPVSLDIDLQQIDLGSLGVLRIAAGMQGGAVVNGNVVLKGDVSVPSTLEGHTHLDLTHVVLDAQNIMGFSLPRLAVSEGKADISFEKNKMLFKTLKLGKGPSDDIRATITGDLTLGHSWSQSTLNAKADFSLSDTILKSPSLALVGALLSQGKMPDNSYSYKLVGPINNLMPTPAK
jgi:type II secretion system protein N